MLGLATVIDLAARGEGAVVRSPDRRRVHGVSAARANPQGGRP